MRKQLVLLTAGLLAMPLSATAMPEGDVLRDEGNAGANVYIDNGGLHVDGGSVNATINAQVQAGYRYIQWDNEGARGLQDSSGFDVSSARIEASGDAVNGEVGYKVEYDFVSGSQGNGDDGGALLDGWAELRLSDQANVRVGQTKVPLSKQQLAEGNQLQFPTRSIDVVTFTPGNGNLGRDEGILLHGDLNGASYALGAFNGETDGETGDNGSVVDTKMNGIAHVSMDIGEYGSRIEEGDMRDGDRPFAATAGLGVLFGQSEQGATDIDRTTLNLDLGMRSAGLDLSGEFFFDTRDPSGGSSREDMGFHVQLGQMFGDHEAAFRFGYVEPDEDFSVVDDIQEYSLALSRFMNGHNSKIQAGITFLETSFQDGSDDNSDIQIDVVLTQRL